MIPLLFFFLYFRIDIVKLVCTSVLNLVQQGGNIGIVANSFGVLAEMLKWYKKYMFYYANSN